MRGKANDFDELDDSKHNPAETPHLDRLAALHDLEHAATAPLLDVELVARLAGVTGETVRRWIDEGKLDGWAIGGRYRIERMSLETMLAKGRFGRAVSKEAAA